MLYATSLCGSSQRDAERVHVTQTFQIRSLRNTILLWRVFVFVVYHYMFHVRVKERPCLEVNELFNAIDKSYGSFRFPFHCIIADLLESVLFVQYSRQKFGVHSYTFDSSTSLLFSYIHLKHVLPRCNKAVHCKCGVHLFLQYPQHGHGAWPSIDLDLTVDTPCLLVLKCFTGRPVDTQFATQSASQTKVVILQ